MPTAWHTRVPPQCTYSMSGRSHGRTETRWGKNTPATLPATGPRSRTYRRRTMVLQELMTLTVLTTALRAGSRWMDGLSLASILWALLQTYPCRRATSRRPRSDELRRGPRPAYLHPSSGCTIACGFASGYANAATSTRAGISTGAPTRACTDTGSTSRASAATASVAAASVAAPAADTARMARVHQPHHWTTVLFQCDHRRVHV